MGMEGPCPSPVADLSAPLPATSQHTASTILAAATALGDDL
jgi:hypothetical protein